MKNNASPNIYANPKMPDVVVVCPGVVTVFE